MLLIVAPLFYAQWEKKEDKQELCWAHLSIVLYEPGSACSWPDFILRTVNDTGVSRTETLTLFQTSAIVGKPAILSATSMSSGNTDPNTV